MLSEFGGLTLDTSDGETWHGYGVVTDAASLLKGYRELVDALLDSPAIAGFCYTQLTDTLQEKNGLVTEDRSAEDRGSRGATDQPAYAGRGAR